MVPCKVHLLVTATAALLTLGAPAHAAEDTLTSETLSMGGAGVASSWDNSSVTVNPGLLALTRRYDLNGHFRLGPDGALQWGAAAVDGRTAQRFSMGLAYSGDRYQPDLLPSERPAWTIAGVTPTNVKRFHDFTLGLAVPFARRRLSVGINGNLALYNHDQQGSGSTGNADVGIAWQPESWATLGLAARNVVPLTVDAVPRSPGVTAGTRLGDRDVAGVLLEGGWVHDTTEGVGDGPPITAAAGAERVFRYVQLRAGYTYYGPDTQHTVTAGLGAGGVRGPATLAWGIQIPLGIDGPVGAALTNQLSLRLSVPEADDPS